jgi:hypothetical protein
MLKKRDVLPDRRGTGSSVGTPGTPYRQCARSTATPEPASLSSEERRKCYRYRVPASSVSDPDSTGSPDPDLDWNPDLG